MKTVFYMELGGGSFAYLAHSIIYVKAIGKLE